MYFGRVTTNTDNNKPKICIRTNINKYNGDIPSVGEDGNKNEVIKNVEKIMNSPKLTNFGKANRVFNYLKNCPEASKETKYTKGTKTTTITYSTTGADDSKIKKGKDKFKKELNTTREEIVEKAIQKLKTNELKKLHNCLFGLAEAFTLSFKKSSNNKTYSIGKN